MLQIGSAQWDEKNKVLYQDGQAVRLPRRALECLHILIQAGGEVVKKDHLQEVLWDGRVVEESNLGQCISALRKVLGPEAIETVVGVGYRLAVPAAEDALPRRRSFRYAAGILLVLGVSAWASFHWTGRIYRVSEADRLYHEGIALVRLGSFTKGMEGSNRFEQALTIDPNHALSYAGMAEAATRFSKLANDSPRKLAEKALQLDPDCAECKAVLGYALMSRELDWPRAGAALEAALLQDPKPIQWRLWRGQWLATQRRFEEAKTLLENAIADDPAKANLRSMLAGVLYFKGDTKAALAECDRAMGISPSHTAPYLWATRAYWQAGNYESAVLMRAIETVRWGGGSGEYEKAVRDDYVGRFRKYGLEKLLNDWLAEFGEGPPRDLARCERAIWQLKLGRKEAALEELEAAAISRPFHSIYLAADPAYASLWPEPRFQAVLKKLGLPLPN